MWENKAHSYDRLMADKVVWLTTVSRNGVPSTAPVWYHVENDAELLVYSKDPSVRVANIEANDRVTVNLNTDSWATDVIVMNGTAVIDRDAVSADGHRSFVAKYQEQLDVYGWTAKWFAENYPTAIRIKIRSVRGG